MPSDIVTHLQATCSQWLLGVHAYRGQDTVFVKREGLLDVARRVRDDAALRFDFLMDLTAVDYLKFGRSQHSAPRLATPSPLPYYMEPKGTPERWERLVPFQRLPPIDSAQRGGDAPAEPKGQAPAQHVGTALVSSDEYRFEVVYHFFSLARAARLRMNVPLSAADPVVDSLTGLWESANWFEREVWDLFGIRFTGHPNLKRILLYESFQGHPLRKDYPVRKRQPLIGPTN